MELRARGSPGAEQEEAAAEAEEKAPGRGEPSLRGAVRELRAELAAFKRGVEQQVAEVLRLAGPLPPSLARLQRDNRQLRAQVERLSRQVESLAAAGEPRARSQSLDLEDRRDAEQGRGGGGTPEPEGSSNQAPFAENGQQHQHPSKESAPDSAPELCAPATTSRKPHHPVTAVTKVTETFLGETVGSPITPFGPGKQHANSNREAVPQTLSQADGPEGSFPGLARSTTSTQKASTVFSERFTTVTKSMSAISYESTTGGPPPGAPHRSPSPPPVVRQQTERRRELVRSQTLPRTSSTQARKALFEKFEQDAGGKGQGVGRPKLKRSQSLGVASASSIKQILLEWCRSKTIGYKHIDLQNFSSSWSDGMAFCALVHSFFPEAFDYQALEPGKARENFELAFTTAEKMAGCDRLIEVEDMLAMGRKPDPMCVFTYVQSLYSNLRHFE